MSFLTEMKDFLLNKSRELKGSTGFSYKTEKGIKLDGWSEDTTAACELFNEFNARGGVITSDFAR